MIAKATLKLMPSNNMATCARSLLSGVVRYLVVATKKRRAEKYAGLKRCMPRYTMIGYKTLTKIKIANSSLRFMSVSIIYRRIN